jgi:hypothetical protein
MSDTEKPLIRKVIQTYFESYLGADADGISQAFFEGTDLLSVDQGSLDRTGLRAWLSNLRERRARGDLRQADAEVTSIDISGDAAMAKAVLRFKEFSFVDYLSLLKIEGRWRIVGKVYARMDAGGQA